MAAANAVNLKMVPVTMNQLIYFEQCLASSNLKLWHDRLGHNDFQDLIKLQNHVGGMQIDKNDSSELMCGTCELNKAKRKAVPKDSVDRAKNALNIVHVDFLGPVTPVTVDNHRYAISFVDSFSRYSKVYFMKTRDECLQYFQQFCANLGTPQTLVGDGAKEFFSTQFSRFCRRIRRDSKIQHLKRRRKMAK